MNVSREVIIDLLPLYAAGEASAATQDLVRDYLSRDPELARIARDHERKAPFIDDKGDEDLERIAFVRMRRRVAGQRWAFGLAWLFTAITLSTEIHIEQGHVT